MQLMHTKLPEFLKKLKAAAVKHGKDIPCEIVGLENLKSAKMQSVRTGRLEGEIEGLSQMPGVERIQVDVIPRVPETMHTVVIRAFDAEGKPLHAVMDTIAIIHPTVDVLIHDCPDVDDRRPPLGRH